MGKAKKAGAVGKARGARSTRTTKGKAKRKAPVKAKRTKARVAKPAKPPKAAKAVKAAPIPSFDVRELDPLRKCGSGTTVQLLFRLDEKVDGVVRPHLVFFDRHGWYCEHGRNCPAVSHARAHARARIRQLEAGARPAKR